MTRQRTILALVIVAVVLVGVAYLGLRQHPEEAWTSFLRGDPIAGGRVFHNKGCAVCHSVAGVGGGRANDLSFIVDEHMSLGQIVGVMWNHGPDMWELIEESGSEFPSIKEREMTDLFAYLYLIRYLDEPGDVQRGARLMSEKGCKACHAIASQGEGDAPGVVSWGTVDNPLLWVQAMWNHGSAMETAMVEKGIKWPEFRNAEMVDLLSYIRVVTNVPASLGNLLPADPRAGKRLFVEKECARCHAIRGIGGTRGPDLGRAPKFPRTLARMAGLMWNHSPRMWQQMEAEHVARPEFSSREMIDLLSYLFAVRYFDETGEPGAGRQVFLEKKCAECHRIGTEGGSGGPDISRWRGRISPIAMAYVMWRHGPKMYADMKEKGMPWPTFKNDEMANLLAFVNTSD